LLFLEPSTVEEWRNWMAEMILSGPVAFLATPSSPVRGRQRTVFLRRELRVFDVPGYLEFLITLMILASNTAWLSGVSGLLSASEQ
jgi:hypothetical protein